MLKKEIGMTEDERNLLIMLSEILEGNTRGQAEFLYREIEQLVKTGEDKVPQSYKDMLAKNAKNSETLAESIKEMRDKISDGKAI